MNTCSIVQDLVTLLVDRFTVYCSILFNVGNNVKSIRPRFNMLVRIMILVPLVLTLVIQITTHSDEKLINNTHATNVVISSNFDVAAAGDWGCSGNTKDTLDNIINKNPDLVLGLGDYSYRINATCWLQIVDPIDHKMKIAIGNHDAEKYVNRTLLPAPERLEQYMSHFNLSEQYYSFNRSNVHFIAMSTEVPFNLGSEQYVFVKNELEKIVSKPGTKWIVVFYHELAYTSPTSAGPSLREFRDIYHPIFQKYGVDVVIQAHSHTYQRSYPIEYNAQNPDKPIVTDKKRTFYDDPSGQIFIIAGTAGNSEMHSFTRAPVSYMAAHFSAYGFLNLNFHNNGSLLTAEFYRNDGVIKDRFSISKEKNNDTNTNSSQPYKPRLMSDIKTGLKIETIFSGLDSPTDMSFLKLDDIVVLGKNNGNIERIVNRSMLERPLLVVNVSNQNERGLLGIAISAKINTRNVFLYYTEVNGTNMNCTKSDYCLPGTDPIGNRLYKYTLTQDGTKLINQKLLLDLPAVPGPSHNGGKIIIGPDNNLYLAVGDINGHKTKAQNYETGDESDGTGGILRIDQQGNAIDNGYLGNEYPLNLYYAYGIRNSFGIDFDPVSGNLWDSENGPDFVDEINLVKPGFNSGWKDVQGIWEHKGGIPQNVSLTPDHLVDFDGKGKYSDPEFSFFQTVGVTAIKFFESDKMGSEYKNDIFVGDIKNGNIYHFDLQDDRQSLALDRYLSDKIADTPHELVNVKFAEGFSGISDLEVGPDGYLYILDYGKGTIYRIVPK